MAEQIGTPHATRPPGQRPQANPGDAAAFLADVTVPDYSPVAAGTRFVKTWRVRNTGRTTWKGGYCLKYVDGDAMGGPPEISFAGMVRPGGDLEVSAPLVAPGAEGAHSGHWQMQNARGELFGARLSVVVYVAPGPAPAILNAPAPKTAAPAPSPAPRLEPSAVPVSPLKNPAFDQGTHAWGGLPAVPQHWDVWFADEDTPRLPRQDQPFARPQAAILSLAEATGLERDAFLAGEHCWKVWAAWRPVWVVLRQRLAGLTPNARYRFIAPIYPDLVMHDGGSGRHYADNPLAGEGRLTASFGGQTLATIWQDGRTVPFGATTFLTLEFSPTTAQVTVAVEMRARWGLERTGWFVNGARLDLVPEGDRPAPPPAGPVLRRPPPQPPRPPRAPRSLWRPRSLAPKSAPKAPAMPPPVELTPIPIRNRLFDLSLDGWETWANVAPGDCAYQTPRFEAYASPVVPYRVLAGRTALRISAEAGQSYEAGVRQTVTGIAPGTPLRYQAHGQAWASTGDDPFRSAGQGTANLRIGIDPHGGKDPNAPGVVWSPAVDSWDEYRQIEVEAVALGEAVTLFLYSHPSPCLKHNETFWDSNALFSTGPAVPLAAPEDGSTSSRPEAGEAATPVSESEPAGGDGPQPAGGNPSGPNLLRNASFDDGYYYRAPELAVPEGWDLWYASGETPKLDRQDVPFAKPESTVWHARDAKKKERERYFRTGDYCWRVCANWKPVWVRLQQRVAGLTPGAAYRFRAPVLAEPWAVSEGPDQRLMTDPVAAEHRLWVETGTTTADTGWLGGENVPYGEFKRLSLDFTAEAEETTVALELRGRWGLSYSQWVVDEVEVRRLE